MPGEDKLTRAAWRTSTRSNGTGACVEVSAAAGVVAVRDSKDRSGPVHTFDRQAWRKFLAAVKAQ